MRFLFFLIVIGTYIMSGCGPLKNTENLNKVSLPDLGEAPELTNDLVEHHCSIKAGGFAR